MKWQNTLDELCEQSRLFVACELELEIIPLNANIREAEYVIHKYGAIDKDLSRRQKSFESKFANAAALSWSHE